MGSSESRSSSRVYEVGNTQDSSEDHHGVSVNGVRAAGGHGGGMYYTDSQPGSNWSRVGLFSTGGAGGLAAGGLVGGGAYTGDVVFGDGAGAYAAGDDGCTGCMCAEAPGPKVMTFVGVGEGDYITEMNYKYVGKGAGDLSLAAPKKYYLGRLCCLLWVLACLVVLFLWWPTSPATTTPFPKTNVLPFDCNDGLNNWMWGWSDSKKTWCCQHFGKGCPTTTRPPLPIGVCLFWGDPHIITFDSSRPSFYGDGEFWIVKSDKVKIQGRFMGTNFTGGLAATNKIIIGGPFLQDHTITVGTLEDGVYGAEVDDNAVLKDFPSTYRLGGIADLTYDAYGELVDKKGMDATWQKHIVHMRLPENVYVTVFRWVNYIDLRIEMPVQPGQDGCCGNFNGDASDDTTEKIMERVGARVKSGDLLFKNRVTVEVTNAELNLLARCPFETQERAKTNCKQWLVGVPHQVQLLDSCILDVCYGDEEHALKLAKRLDFLSA